MTTVEERELSRVLQARAASIVVAPRYRIPDEDVLSCGPTAGPDRNRPVARMAAVAAVVVLAAVGGSIAWSRSSSRQHGTAAMRTCASTGTGPFATAVRERALPDGAEALAVDPQGSVLVATERAGATTRLQLIGPTRTRTLWRAGREPVRVVVNRSGALGDGVAAAVLVPVAGGAPTVLAVDSYTGTTVLHAERGWAVGADAATAPVALDEGVQIVETSTTRPALQRTVQYFVEPELSDPTPVVARMPRVDSLLAVGGNEIMTRRSADGSVTLVSGDAAALPSTLAPALRAGRDFVADGTTMAWLVGGDVLRWRPGLAAPRRRALPVSSGGYRLVSTRLAVAAERDGRQRVVDVATGRATDLPRGATVVASGGPTAVLAVSGRVVRVPIVTVLSC